MAKVTELYRLQILIWARVRDYYPAELCALTLNSRRTEHSQRVFEAADFLSAHYPQQKTVMITHDPDTGASCAWQDLRQSLKDRREATHRRRRNG